MDFIRLWTGPHPGLVCDLVIMSKDAISMAGIQIGVAMILIKFMFIVIWKTMRPLDDNFLKTWIVTNSILISILFSFAKTFGPGKPVMNKILCTGIFNPLQENLGPQFAIYQFVIGFSLLIYVIVYFLIFFKNFDAPIVTQNSKNLESLFLNLAILVILGLAGIAAHQMNS